MKAIKYLSIAALALSMAACSNEEGPWNGDTDWDNNYGWNSKEGVVVEMSENAIEVFENQGIFNVPIKVTGERNGYVRVTIDLIEVSSEDADPAMVNAHYFVTSRSVNISPESNTGHVEIRTHDNRGQDPTRTFIVKIASVKGKASIGSENQTLVSIYEKGSSPVYADLEGDWFISGVRYNVNTNDLDEQYFEVVTLKLTDPDKKLVTIGPMPFSFTSGALQLWYNYDDEEKYGDVVLKNGAPFAGRYTIETADMTDCVGKWAPGYNAITFGDANSVFYVLDAKGQTNDIFGYFTISRMKN